LFLAAAQKGLLWASLIAVFTGLLTVACFVRAAYLICWGSRRGAALGVGAGLRASPVGAALADGGGLNPEEGAPGPGSEREVPVSIWIGMGVLVVLIVALGLFPNLAYPLLDRATDCIRALLPGA
jgi:formate hydrogenlyase subunit 3/multisubunit Na+/H+ antiporter MnhD subunit